MKLKNHSSFNISPLANNNRNKKTLKYITLLFIVIVAVALIVLVQYTFSQLQWEKFHQNRLQTEALSLRLDKNLQNIIDEEERRPIDEYRFLSLVASLESNNKAPYFKRSVLSQLPLQSNVPGIIGYFQLDANNQFSTPLVPQQREQAIQYGLSAEEYKERVNTAKQLATILMGNALLLSKAELAQTPAPVIAEEPIADAHSNNQSSLSSESSVSKAAPTVKVQSKKSATFDKLEDKVPFTPSNKLGRVNDLLEKGQNNEFDKRSRLLEAKKSKQQTAVSTKQSIKKQTVPVRQLRKEQRVITESFSSAPSLNGAITEDAGINENDKDDSGASAPFTVEIFESEVEPFQVNLLESGHVLIFRRVWTQNQRLIQGMLIDKARFIEAIIQNEFINSALSENSRLAFAYQGNILAAYGEIEKGRYGYLDNARQLSGTVLYQKTLLSPFDEFNLVFTIGDLSSGSSGQVVLMSALILLFTVLLGAWLFNRYANAQQALMNQQQDFISSVSHELKTPLTSIRMYGEMLKEGWVSEAKRKEYYHFIFDESERLSRLINNVLQLAKLNRNTLEPNLKPYSIDALINMTETKLSGHAASEGFELIIKHNQETDLFKAKKVKENNQQVIVNLDEDLFIQIMINLVDNALKYSINAEVKKIELDFSTNNKEELSISVRDYGPGIEPEKLKKIFDLFYRNENELTREAKGTGIGLALVAQYVQLMQGQVSANNTNPGLEVLVFFSYCPIQNLK